jgi:uncharacterized paraquat-inducible protein A
VRALWEDEVNFFAIFLAVMVMIIPGLKWLSMFCVWFVKAPVKYLINLKHIVSGIAKWSMLDCFTLGFFIFIFEASEIVAVEYRFGLIAMWISFFINTTLDIIYHTSISATIRKFEAKDLEHASSIVRQSQVMTASMMMSNDDEDDTQASFGGEKIVNPSHLAEKSRDSRNSNPYESGNVNYTSDI